MTYKYKIVKEIEELKELLRIFENYSRTKLKELEKSLEFLIEFSKKDLKEIEEYKKRINKLSGDLK